MYFFPSPNAKVDRIHGGMLFRQIRTLELRTFVLFERTALTVIGKNFRVTRREALIFCYWQDHHGIHTRISVSGGRVREQAPAARTVIPARKRRDYESLSTGSWCQPNA
ncbi:MAG TPA: hypothetical protein VI653_14665, partial [Steroidobacteraceae bacterium]